MKTNIPIELIERLLNERIQREVDKALDERREEIQALFAREKRRQGFIKRIIRKGQGKPT